MMPYQSMALPMMNSVGWVGGKFTDSSCALSSTPSSYDSPLRFEQRTDKKPSQGLTQIATSEILYPAAAPLCLTRVKFPGTKVYSLFVWHCKLTDNSLPLQSAYLSIYSAYLAIRFEDLPIVPPIGRVLPLLEMFIHLGLNQDA